MLSAVQFMNAAKDPDNVILIGHIAQEDEASSTKMGEGMERLVEEYRDVFPDELPSGKPPDRGIAHKIDLQPEAEPVFGPVYRLSYLEADELKRQLEDLEEKGYIQPSKSPFGAPVLLVKKQDGSLRLCVDYRALNRVTKKNRYPMPFITDLTDRLHGARYFSKIDLRSGYWQVKVAEEDVHKTAFRTRYGHYEFNVMPFGLTNAPATFMRMMNDVLRPLLDECVVVYLDDILIYSKTLEEHKVHVSKVLQLLRENQLYAKLSKCSFAQSQVDYLGYRIDTDGLHAEERKLSAVKEWPEPADKHQLMQFLGLANYYRKFVQNFSTIAAPLTALLKKVADWDWTEQCRQAFESLKLALTIAPVLVIPDPRRDFELTTDAGNVGIGAVLSQAGKPVMYFSRKLRTAEMNYRTHDKEALAIVEAVKQWRVYLLGREVKVFTDHNSLQYHKTQPNLNSRQRRWLEDMADFSLDIRYKPGKENRVADALSRRPDFSLANLGVCEPSSEILDSLDSLRAYYKEHDPKGTDLREVDGLFYQQGVAGEMRLLIPSIPEMSQLRQTIMSECHDSAYSGHLGFDKTLELVQRNFVWQGQHEEVRQFVATCPSCQQCKHPTRKKAGMLQPLPLPECKWDHISMDLITQLPRTGQGHDAIIVFVDCLTRMIHMAPTTSDVSAPETAKLLLRNVMRLHGQPKAIVSDRDGRFTSHFWQSLMRSLGTKLKMSTAFHPQTDGLTERANQTVEQMLRAFVNADHTDWDEHLDLVEFAYNNSLQASSGHTPFFLNSGTHPNTPLKIAAQSNAARKVPAAMDFLLDMGTAMDTAKANLLAAQQRQKRYADEHRRETDFKVGQKVNLSTQNLHLKEGQAKKLPRRFVGPFEVLEVVSPVAYKLKLPRRMKIHPVFHVSLLKEVKEDPRRPVELTQPGPLYVLQDGGEIYEAQEIVGKKQFKGTTKYKVKWKDWP